MKGEDNDPSLLGEPTHFSRIIIRGVRTLVPKSDLEEANGANVPYACLQNVVRQIAVSRRADFKNRPDYILENVFEK